MGFSHIVGEEKKKRSFDRGRGGWIAFLPQQSSPHPRIELPSLFCWPPLGSHIRERVTRKPKQSQEGVPCGRFPRPCSGSAKEARNMTSSTWIKLNIVFTVSPGTSLLLAMVVVNRFGHG
jgi:hypothetical protein